MSTTIGMTTKNEDRYERVFKSISKWDRLKDSRPISQEYRDIMKSLMMCMTKRELDKWISDAESMGLEDLLYPSPAKK